MIRTRTHTHEEPEPDDDRIHVRIITEPHPDRPGWRVAAVAWRDDVTVRACEGEVVVKRDSLPSNS